MENDIVSISWWKMKTALGPLTIQTYLLATQVVKVILFVSRRAPKSSFYWAMFGPILDFQKDFCLVWPLLVSFSLWYAEPATKTRRSVR